MEQNTLTIEQVVDSFSQGLSPDKRAVNLQFVKQVHASLKEDGCWVSPTLGTIFQRKGEGFVDITADVAYVEMQEAPHVE